MKTFMFLAFITLCSARVILNTPEYSLTANVQHSKVNQSGCDCLQYSCGCCAHLEVAQVGLNDTVCVNLTYLPQDYGFSFTITIDNYTVYNYTISAHNPPPICFGAPMLKQFADLCLRFYDLTVTSTKAHGCVDIEARFERVVVASYNLGCFNINFYGYGTKYLKVLRAQHNEIVIFNRKS